MDAEAKRALRLIEALEILAQEEQVVAGRDAAAVIAIQRRSAPLVADLAKLAGCSSVARFRPRVQALVNSRQSSTAAMNERMDALRVRLAALSESNVQLKRVGPAYGKPRRVTERFAQSV